MSGTHEFSGGGFASIKAVNNISWIGDNSESTKIVCDNHSGFAFMNIMGLSIQNLTFVSCGARINQKLSILATNVYTSAAQAYKLNPYVNAALFLTNVHFLTISGISVQHSIGYGLLAINALGNSTLTHSEFIYNNFYTLGSAICREYLFPADTMNVNRQGNNSETICKCQGGNALFIFAELVQCHEEPEKHTLVVNKSSFKHGVDITGSFQLLPENVAGGSGFGVKIAPASYAIEIILDEVECTSNNAHAGPNMYFGVSDFVSEFAVHIRKSKCTLGNTLLDPALKNAMAPLNAGLFYDYGLKLPHNFKLDCHVHYPEKTYIGKVKFTNSLFTWNNGTNTGGVMLSFTPRYNYGVVQLISFSNCTFRNNIHYALLISELHSITMIRNLFSVVLENSQFTENQSSKNCSDLQLPDATILTPGFGATFPSTVALDYVQNATFVNVTFTHNTGTAIRAKKSTIYFQGHVEIVGNVGYLGAGLSLWENSYMVLKPNTHIWIANNKAALRGGAIYVENYNNANYGSPCFFQVDNPELLTNPQARVIISNNSATESGSALYGGQVDTCGTLYKGSQPEFLAPQTLFKVVFSIRPKEISDKSEISSDPVQVCLCRKGVRVKCVDDGQRYFIQPVRSKIHAYPGAVFKVEVVTVGQRYGAVPGVIRSELQHKGGHLGPFQSIQAVGKNCQNVSYQIFSSNPVENILLRTEKAAIGIPQVNIDLQVKLLPCPPAFHLSNQSGTCGCAHRLQEQNLICNIDNKTIERSGTVWISVAQPANTSEDYIMHEHCPFDFCNPMKITLTLDQPDRQCAFNRSSILCGKCNSGYSLALGTSRCLKCSHHFIALTLVFALAGLLLVVLLIGCNLTVSTGTVNGLVFYANVIRVNTPILLPQGNTNSVLWNILTVFIAWLNLDIGIETCYYDGMDTYTRTWLQFIFPIYIWAIVGFIIYASRHSNTVVKLVGRNVISVLTTLFLLSYTKLQRTIITSFSFTYLTYPGNHSSPRWLYDPNITFLQGKHIPLFIAAVVFGLFFIIPFTFLLLFAPCIQAYSGHWTLRWTKNFIPLLDSYQGPYKNNTRYWTGLMLVVRTILFTVYAINSLGDPKINLLVTASVVILILALNLQVGTVYKRVILNFLETSFVLNLGILTL